MPWGPDGTWIENPDTRNTGLVPGSQGIGTVAGGYQAPPGLLANYNPLATRVFTDRGLPPSGRTADMNVFGERAVQGAPLSSGEQQFWAAHPGGASAAEVYGFDPTGPGTLGKPQSNFPAVMERTAPQVDADSLINSAISRRQELEGRRMGLENQRTRLFQQYSALPLGRHGRETPQHTILKEKLRGLAEDERMLRSQEGLAEHEAGMRLTSAFRNADLANKNLEFQRKEQTARDAAAVLSGLSVIESRYRHGTPEFRQAVIDLTDANPMYMHSSSASAAVRKASEFHDIQEPKVSNQAATRYARLQGNIQAHQEAAKLEEAANIKTGKANEPYSKAKALHGDQAELAILEKRFPGLSALRQQATPAPTPQNNLAAPVNPAERVNGQIYTNPSGKPARWNAQTQRWTPIE